jgi:hypothetical protein
MFIGAGEIIGKRYQACLLEQAAPINMPDISYL